MERVQPQEWTEVIEARNNLWTVNLKEVWRYRDLLLLLIRRDFVANFKQTLLGPIWFVVQPLLTSLTFVIIFGRIAGLSTDGLPQILFYLAGVTLWSYFAECLNKSSTVFKDNANVFGKVYFPRLIMPLSIICSGMIKLAVQYSLFLVFWLYYLLIAKANLQPNIYILLTPLLAMLMGGLGLGLGMIISSMTTKYRDLIFLITFGIQLLMYATPVIYPLSSIGEKYRWLIELNPMTGIIETFKYAYLGSGEFSWGLLGYSASITVVVLILGTLIFNKVEKSFMDTV